MTPDIIAMLEAKWGVPIEEPRRSQLRAKWEASRRWHLEVERRLAVAREKKP